MLTMIFFLPAILNYLFPEKERLGQLLGNLFWIDPIANAAKYVS